MIAEQIWQHQRRIQQLEDKIYDLQQQLKKLDIAEAEAGKKKDDLYQLRDRMIINVNKAYERGCHLRIMEDVREKMKGAISGTSFEKMLNSIIEVQNGIDQDRAECIRNINRMKDEIAILRVELDRMQREKEVKK